MAAALFFMLERPMILCKDCLHVDKRDNEIRCLHPQSGANFTDYYTGETFLAYPSIQFARSCGECGEDAKLFALAIGD